nr:ketopantoate reductase C-terminal domain-containing protein [Cupriavidus sp. AcVe19-6a]
MLCDVENRSRTEADHILGDLIARGAAQQGGPLSLLQVAYSHLKAYEARQARGGWRPGRPLSAASPATPPPPAACGPPVPRRCAGVAGAAAFSPSS